MKGALSQTEFARDWLDQFTGSDRKTAAKLADSVMLVSHDTLYRGLRSQLDELISDRGESDLDRPIALYAERAVQTRLIDEEHRWLGYSVLPFFPGTEEGRATGAGIAPILVDPKDQEVGSEGAIANFITSFERLHRDRILNHPGPDALREKRATHIVIVTDFIGSGKRVCEMLEAFWQVATIRSWHSYGLIKLAVVAYSGTEQGLARVRQQRTSPSVKVMQVCPTLSTSFEGADLIAVSALCQAFPSRHKKPFGFKGAGALVAFAHGMPNNAPPILHSTVKGWRPLFVNRSALAADQSFPEDNSDALGEQARTVLRIRAATSFLDDPLKRRWIKTMLILSAIEHGARGAAAVSARTRIRLTSVEQILEFTQIAHWTNEGGLLTLLGKRELRRLRQRRARAIVLPTVKQPYYYPTQLRAR
jgi:hypothetical protein